MKITFYIARHGRTILNTLGRIQGWCDSFLTKEGREVAEYLGKGLKGIEFNSVYTSDLRRTRETALLALKNQGQTDLPIQEMQELREVCFGAFEGAHDEKMWNVVAKALNYNEGTVMLSDVFNKSAQLRYEQIVNKIKELDTMHIAESFEEVEKRAQQALKEIAEKEAKEGIDKNIFMVSHGMCIVIMLMNLGGRKLFTNNLDNASISKVVYENGNFTVESLGDVQYIQKGKEISLNN